MAILGVGASSPALPGHLIDEHDPPLQALQAAVAMAKQLSRASPKTGEPRSLRKIGAELQKAGFLNEPSRPYVQSEQHQTDAG
jgi:hypothetical protein